MECKEMWEVFSHMCIWSIGGCPHVDRIKLDCYLLRSHMEIINS